MSSYFRLFRVQNLLILALMQVLVRVSIIEPVLSRSGFELRSTLADFILLVLSTLLVAAAGYAINDYFDVRIDQINKPGKNVLSVKIPLRRAIILHTVLNIAGILIAFYCAYRAGSVKLGFIHIVATLVLWFYSLKYKRNLISGNVAISLLAALAVVLVWLYEFYSLKLDATAFAALIGNFNDINTYVFGYAAFAFLITLIREIIKDIEDVEGDKAYRCRTIPIVWGEKAARLVALSLLLVMIMSLVYILYVFRMMNHNYAFWFILITVVPVLLFLGFRLMKSRTVKDYHAVSNLLKIAMVAGILSMQTLFFNF